MRYHEARARAVASVILTFAAVSFLGCSAEVDVEASDADAERTGTLNQALDADREVLFLSNCYQDGTQFSEEDWYPSDRDSWYRLPTATARPGRNTAIQWNGHIWWEGSPVRATFADGNWFSSTIPKRETGGYGVNRYHTYECNQTFYQLYRSGSKTCDAVYACQVNDDLMRVDVQTSAETVTLYGAKQSAADIVGRVARDPWNSCNQQFPIDGTQCSIRFDCSNTYDRWEALGNTLGYAAKQTQFAKTGSARTWCTNYVGGPGVAPPGICTAWATVQTSTLPAKGNVQAMHPRPGNNVVYNDWQGQVSYSISCPNRGHDANLCSGTEAALTAAGAIPVIGSFFNLPKAVVMATCN